MELKLAVSDVDGTLVAEGSKAFSHEFDSLVSLIIQKKIPFTIASGRSPEQLEPMEKLFHINLPVIAYNGALIMQGKKEIFNSFLNASELKEAILKGDEIGLSILMGIGYHEYTFRKNDYIVHHEKDYGWFHSEYDFATLGWENTKFNKILFFDYEGFKNGSAGKADIVYNILLKMQDHMQILRYDEYCVEVMPKGVNKASGIQELSKKLHLDMAQIIAFGDSDNDLEMLTECGLGIAVGNAVKSVKESADYICSAPDSSGVLEALKKFWPEEAYQ